MSHKLFFTLKNIDYEDILKELRSIPQKNTYLNFVESKPTPPTATKITDMCISGDIHIEHITMIDHLTNGRLPEVTNIACFWCTESFRNCPIGCPVNFIHDQYEKKYFSEITNDNYTIKYNISSDIKLPGVPLIKNGYYETDGVFCSSNCCMAFILDNQHRSKYRLSKSLLFKMLGTRDITTASHWRVLKKFGGNISIEEFRHGAKTLNHIGTEVPDMVSQCPVFISNNAYETRMDLVASPVS